MFAIPLGFCNAAHEVDDDGRFLRRRRNAALVDALAQLGLSRPDRRERDHRIGAAAEIEDACHALGVEPSRGQGPIGGRERRVPALRHPRADADLLPQLERRLEQVRVQPGSGVEPGEQLGRRRSLEATVADQPANDGTILLLHPRLVVLPIGTRTRHLEALRPAPGDHRVIHEGADVVEINASERERKQLLRGSQRFQHERTCPHHHRHALGPARGDIGQHQRLDEGPGRADAGMRHEVDLDEARRRIAPVGEGSDRHRPPHRRTEAGPPPASLRCRDPRLRQQPVDRRRADRQELRAQLLIGRELPVPLKRRQQDRDHRLQPFRADPVRRSQSSASAAFTAAP